MSGTVPSELLEGPVTQLVGILITEYAWGGCTDEGFRILCSEIRAIDMLVSSLGATYCSLALNNEIRSKIMKAEVSEEARKAFDESCKQVIGG